MKKLIYLLMFSVLILPACEKSEEPLSQALETPVLNNEAISENELTEIDPTQESQQDFEEGYNYKSPEWEEIRSDIEKQTGEEFQSLNAPQSRSDKNVIFVSTSKNLALLPPGTNTVNKVYSYNIQTKELKELFKDESAFDENFHYTDILFTVGLEGDKLILLQADYSFSPGPCFSPLSYTSDLPNGGYVYLDLKNPDNGISTYTLPSYLIEKTQKDTEKCEQEIAAEQ